MMYNLGVFAALCASNVEGMKRPICREMMKNHRLIRRLMGEHLKPGWRRRLPSDGEVGLGANIRKSSRLGKSLSRGLRKGAREMKTLGGNWENNGDKEATFHIKEDHEEYETDRMFVPMGTRQLFTIKKQGEDGKYKNIFCVKKIVFFQAKDYIDGEKKAVVRMQLEIKSVEKKMGSMWTSDRVIQVGEYYQDNEGNGTVTFDASTLQILRKIFGYRKCPTGKITSNVVTIAGSSEINEQLTNLFKNEIEVETGMLKKSLKDELVVTGIARLEKTKKKAAKIID